MVRTDDELAANAAKLLPSRLGQYHTPIHNSVHDICFMAENSEFDLSPIAHKSEGILLRNLVPCRAVPFQSKLLRKISQYLCACVSRPLRAARSALPALPVLPALALPIGWMLFWVFHRSMPMLSVLPLLP